MSQNPTQMDPSILSSTQQILQQSETIHTDTELLPKDIAQLQQMQLGRQIVSWATAQYDKLKSARMTQENVWYKNIAAYSKNDRVVIAQQANGAPVAREKKNKNEYWVNRIRPYVRTEIARFTSNQPSATVVPATADDDDMYIAQVAEQVWVNQYKDFGFREVFLDTAWWLSITGNGFIKTWWDKNIADPRVVPSAGEEPETGNIRYGNVTPFNLWVPDFVESKIEDQPFIINAYTKPVEWVELFYGDLLKAQGVEQVKPDATAATEILNEVRMGIRSGGTESKKDSVLIKEFWVKPGATKHMPKGGMVTIINGKLVQANLEGLPYPHGQYPFAKFDNIPTGSFYAASGIEDLDPINREYNFLRRTIRGVGALNANPQYVYVEGSTNVKRITNRPGQWIPVKPGMQFPYPLPKSDVPASVYNSLQNVLADFEDVSGQHQVSKGSAPPGVTAATAINYLQEKDDSYVSTAYSSIELGTEKVARQTLSLASAYWTQDRMIQTIGEDDGVMDVMLINGQRLSKGTNIRIDGGSAMPQSPAAKRAYLLELLQMGVINQDQFLDLSQMGGMQSVAKHLKRDQNHAQRENIKFRAIDDEYLAIFDATYKENIGAIMAKDPEKFITEQIEQNGMSAEEFASLSKEEQDEFLETMDPPETPLPIPVNEWDNHEVHIEVHNNFRKTQAFELLPESVKELIDRHVLEHERKLQETQFGSFMDTGAEFDPMSGADMGEGQLPPDLMEINMANSQPEGPGDDPNSLQQSNG